MSINHSPIVTLLKSQPLLISPTFVYLFDKDSSLAVGNFVVPDYYVSTIKYNVNDIPLVKDTETVDIVTVSDPKEITSGEISGLVFVASTSNQDHTVVVRFYGNSLGLIFESSPTIIPSNSTGVNSLGYIDTNGITIPAGEIISMRVEGTSNDLTIKSTSTPSQLKLTRKNL